jgi:hypothetical protein
MIFVNLHLYAQVLTIMSDFTDHIFWNFILIVAVISAMSFGRTAVTDVRTVSQEFQNV